MIVSFTHLLTNSLKETCPNVARHTQTNDSFLPLRSFLSHIAPTLIKTRATCSSIPKPTPLSPTIQLPWASITVGLKSPAVSLSQPYHFLLNQPVQQILLPQLPTNGEPSSTLNRINPHNNNRSTKKTGAN